MDEDEEITNIILNHLDEAEKSLSKEDFFKYFKIAIKVIFNHVFLDERENKDYNFICKSLKLWLDILLKTYIFTKSQKIEEP